MTLLSLPTLLALLAAVVTALAVEVLAARRGEAAPGFTPPAPGAAPRRALATVLLAGVFYVGVFLSFTVDGAVELDLSAVAPWQLFTLHLLLGATLLAWGLLAHAAPGRPGAAPEEGSGAPAVAEPSASEAPATETATSTAAAESASTGPPAAPVPVSAARSRPPLGERLLRAFRLAEPRPLREIGVGLLAGLAIWAGVIFAVGVLAAALYALGGESLLPQGAPPLVAFIAAQPLWLRFLGSLSAGFFEETFFRGFLQPRVGIALSTLLFALAHWSYGEPFMLVGVTLLSLAYAALARWRRSVWAAVTAHAVFDAVQLLILVPLALEAVEAGEPLAWVATAALW